MNTLVLGIGNTYLQDEGVGVHVARYLNKMQPHNGRISYIDGGVLEFPLQVPLRNSDNLVVIDAAELHNRPGTVMVFLGYDMDIFVSSRRHCSMHEVGLSKLLSIVRLTDDLPRNRGLISIQPKTVAWGDTLSDDVIASIPVACRKAMQLATKWQQ